MMENPLTKPQISWKPVRLPCAMAEIAGASPLNLIWGAYSAPETPSCTWENHFVIQN